MNTAGSTKCAACTALRSEHEAKSADSKPDDDQKAESKTEEKQEPEMEIVPPLSEYEINLLHHGYFRTFYGEHITPDIIGGCMKMYGPRPFIWEISGRKNLNALIEATQKSRVYSLRDEAFQMESDVFKVQHVPFRLSLKCEKAMVQIKVQLLSKEVIVRAVVSLQCLNPRYQFQKFHEFSHYLDGITASERWTHRETPKFRVSAFKGFEAEKLYILCNIKPLRIESISKIHQIAVLPRFELPIPMKQSAVYIWSDFSDPVEDDDEGDPYRYYRARRGNEEDTKSRIKKYYYLECSPWRFQYAEPFEVCHGSGHGTCSMM